MKCTAMGRPLSSISPAFLHANCVSRARTSCLWLASSSRGTSSPCPLWTLLSLRRLSARTRVVVSMSSSSVRKDYKVWLWLHRDGVWCSRGGLGGVEVLLVGRPQAGVSRLRASAHPASRQTQHLPSHTHR